MPVARTTGVRDPLPVPQWCTGKVRGCDGTGRPTCAAVACFYGTEPCPSRTCNRFQPIGGRCACGGGDGDARPDPPAAWRDRAIVERLYLQEGLSSGAIARRFGVADVTVLDWLHRFRIPIRDAAARPHHKGRHPRSTV